MAPSTGTKVTKDPQAEERIHEAPGAITSDSLAAESLANDGSFGNAKAAPLPQPSRSTTTNTHDTSAATILPPAPDAEARSAESEWSESARLSAGRGLGQPGEDAGKGVVGTTAKQGDATSTYVTAAVTGEGKSKPKGANITEGGFDDNVPNASFTTEIGTEKDPGRFAEQHFQQINARSGADVGGGSTQSGGPGSNTYEALDREEAS